MAWTTAQKKVIETRDKNILVSAAAGSGKTAVLVERIIKRVLDQENPLDIDKILVVTFTNAAAGEMRERVLKAIGEELAKNPDDPHLQRQQTYIHNAYITTMHSFCLQLVREHFNEIDLDPAVRVADAGEIALLKADVVGEVLEEYYSLEDNEQREAFFRFVRQFERKNDDDVIEEMVLSLYHKAMGYPYPKKWLAQCVEQYNFQNEEALADSAYVQLLNNYASGVLKELARKYDDMLYFCSLGGPDKYVAFLEQEQKEIEAILAEEDYERRRVKLNKKFEALPRCSSKETVPELKEKVQSLRKKVKEDCQKLRDRIYGQSLSQAVEKISQCYEITKTYVEVVSRFIDRFQEKKKEKNLLDFDDFEHYAIAILTTEKDGEYVPSKVADELAARFEEIMVDEYQDSNLVQETILSALCKERFGGHNRFMVGDVKQSIYGFRGANPHIFMEKYQLYGEQTDREDCGNCRIILDKNFRSRKGVIDTTNFIFGQIMGKDLGGIDYDEENRLYQGLVLDAPPKALQKGMGEETELLLINTKEAITKVVAEQAVDEEEDLAETALVAEAKVIARKIRTLTDRQQGMTVYDKNEKCYRRLCYSDIVILLRSIGKNAEYIQQELMKAGIPAYMESRTGYFKTPEIRTLLNYLRIIDNPLQDIPLAGVLKSVIVGVQDEELALIRAVGGKNISLYEDIEQYLAITEKNGEAEIAFDAALAGRLQSFMEQLAAFRRQRMYLSIYELVTQVLDVTGYCDHVAAMPAGNKRLANIEMFKTKAAEYEKGSYQGLFHFIRYIDKMNRYNVEMGEASIANENDNTVRIMTIHKSKGLEFPVVFVANLQKSFNHMDEQGKYVIHTKLGIGMDYTDEENDILSRNIIKTAISRQIGLEMIEEELRLFYVACTRARDKLIFSGSGVDRNRLMKMLGQQTNKEEYLGAGVVSQFDSYMDFVTTALSRNQAFQKIYAMFGITPPAANPIFNRFSNVEVQYIGLSEIMEKIMEERVSDDIGVVAVRRLETGKVYSSEISEALEKRLYYRYPYQKQTLTHAKMSVSEIKKVSFLADEIKLEEQAEVVDFMEPYLQWKSADFEKEETEQKELKTQKQEQKEPVQKEAFPVTGSHKGTVYHTVFEKFDYSRKPDYENIEALLLSLQAQGILSQEEKDSVWIKDFLQFAGTGLYERMRAADSRGELFREVQFVVGFYESEIEAFKEAAKIIGETGKLPVFTSKKSIEKQPPAGDMELSEDTVLVQGIIDAYFVENGKIVIVDYKTDHVEKEEELVRHYAIQLELYKKAVEQITKLPVSEKILYSTRLGREIIV